jgi:hypothetical protein
MTATLGVDTRTSVEKSETKKRKWFFSITWADIIDDVKTWRKHPNYVSELFDTKKAATTEMYIQLAKFAKIIVNNKFVICKDNHCWENSLTIGKEYSVITETEDTYELKDNYGEVNTFYKKRFMLPKRLVNTSNNEDNNGFGDAAQAYALYVQDGKVLTDGYIYNNYREGGYTSMSDLHTLLKEIVRQYPNYLVKLNKHLSEPIIL